MDYLIQHFDRVGPRLAEHIEIAGLTLVIALLIAIPLGIGLSRVPVLATLVLGALGVVYTIPSLALLAFLVPFFGLGTTTAVIALVAYSQFALVRNVVVAFAGVDPAVREAARGMGLTPAQVLWQVEWPLALPLILAGARIATLLIIGLTTIAAWVGAGGLGQILRTGVTQDNPPVIVAGVICVSAMALVADLAFRALERKALVYRSPLRADGPNRNAEETPLYV
ncbi:MAG TPA: ABC transporter permease [Chloroflexia bacterium]|nr:ABC transporter permease [Chloroflexia bacterium]